MQKIQLTTVAIALASLGGCVTTPPQQPDIPASQVSPTPVCSGQEQCDRMWARAIEAVPVVSRMRIMIANDRMIQTFPTREIGYLNGSVLKHSLGGGRYAIEGTFSCAPYTWCSSFANTTQNAFNAQVNAAQ